MLDVFVHRRLGSSSFHTRFYASTHYRGCLSSRWNVSGLAVDVCRLRVYVMRCTVHLLPCSESTNGHLASCVVMLRSHLFVQRGKLKTFVYLHTLGIKILRQFGWNEGGKSENTIGVKQSRSRLWLINIVYLLMENRAHDLFWFSHTKGTSEMWGSRFVSSFHRAKWICGGKDLDYSKVHFMNMPRWYLAWYFGQTGLFPQVLKGQSTLYPSSAVKFWIICAFVLPYIVKSSSWFLPYSVQNYPLHDIGLGTVSGLKA